MKKSLATQFTLAALMVLGFSAVSQAQGNSSRLTRIADDVAKLIQEKKADWKRQTVTPMTGSENVVVDHWLSGALNVKIAIIEHASSEQATDELQKLLSGRNIKERLQDLGEDGYTWSAQGEVAFRKGNLTVYISATATAAEEASLCKEFARLTSEALRAR